MLVALVFVLGFSYVSVSRPFYSFDLILPGEVNASANSTIVVDGKILVTGDFWLHNYKMNLTGLPSDYKYNITPAYWETVRILREWNPTDGVYRVPENFTVNITIPKNASGLYAVTITGQENWSWRLVTNSSTFILRVGVTKPAANVTQPTNKTVERNVSTNVTETKGILINISQYFIGIPALIFAVLLWKSAQMWSFYRIRGKPEEM